mgnify:CR=1 FL=1
MATHHGNDGSVAVGANTVAEITEFSVNETGETADDSAMGDTARSHKGGKVSWTGILSCWWDETDTDGQEALTVGASVTLNLYPEGSGSGARYATGTATITEVGVTTPQDGIVTRSFSFQGNGALTWDDVS